MSARRSCVPDALPIAAAIVSIVSVVGAGCGSTSTYHVVTSVTAPPWTGVVYLVPEGAALPPRFTEGGLVQAIGRGAQADSAHVLEGLRDEAAALGCNAVIHVHVDQGQATASGTGVAVRTGEGPPAPLPSTPRPYVGVLHEGPSGPGASGSPTAPGVTLPNDDEPLPSLPPPWSPPQ